MRTKALAAFAASALALGTCATTGAPPPSHAFPLWERTLPSGMRVLVEQDDTASVAGIVLVVDVGSADDPTDKPGLAHTLEHLVFRVPDEAGMSLATRLGRQAAPTYNAATGVERTTYFAFAPQRSMDDLVAMLLARMADPLRGATDALLAKEASIVAEELRMREGASGSEVLMPALLPPGHPHARAYAARRQTAQLSLADVRAFAGRHYRPERMTLVISGPITAAWVSALWGKVPTALHGREAERRPPARREVAAFPGPARAEADLPVRKAKVDGPELWMAWRLPPAQGIAARKLEVIARVVDRVLSGRLHGDDSSGVIDIETQALPGNLSSALICRFKLRSSADAVRIRDETKAALEALTDVTLMRIKGRLWWGYVQAVQEATIRTALGMESLGARALARAELVHAGGSALLSKVFDTLAQTTIDDISDFAAHYLEGDASSSVLLISDRSERVARRGGPGDASAPATSVLGVQADAEPEPDFDDAGGRPLSDIATVAQAPGARAARVQTLSNGLTAIALRRPGLPFVAMRLGFHADPQPGEAPGVRHVIDTSMRWELSTGPLARGLLRKNERSPDALQETLTMLADNAGKALDLLSEEADSLQLFWPNPQFDRWADAAARSEATPEDRAARAFRTALFGDHAYHLRPAMDVVRKVTGPDAAKWIARVRRPANGALVIVGDIDPEAVLRDAERELRGWKGDASPSPAPPAPPARPSQPAAAPSIVYVEDAYRASVALRFGCFLPPVRSPRDELVHDLLASGLESALYDRLRVKMGVSYAPHVRASSVRGGTSWLEGNIDVDGNAAPQALALVRGWLDRAQPFVLDNQTFERLRWQKARRSALSNDTNEELVDAIFGAWNMGWAPAVLDDYPRDLASVTVGEMIAAFEACRARSVISVLAAAPIAYN
jgi:zinc protease